MENEKTHGIFPHSSHQRRLIGPLAGNLYQTCRFCTPPDDDSSMPYYYRVNDLLRSQCQGNEVYILRQQVKQLLEWQARMQKRIEGLIT